MYGWILSVEFNVYIWKWIVFNYIRWLFRYYVMWNMFLRDRVELVLFFVVVKLDFNGYLKDIDFNILKDSDIW